MIWGFLMASWCSFPTSHQVWVQPGTSTWEQHTMCKHHDVCSLRNVLLWDLVVTKQILFFNQLALAHSSLQGFKSLSPWKAKLKAMPSPIQSLGDQRTQIWLYLLGLALPGSDLVTREIRLCSANAGETKSVGFGFWSQIFCLHLGVLQLLYLGLGYCEDLVTYCV